MEEIERAILHGAVAGKLRAYVRENGSGLTGLERLADKHSGDAEALLGLIGEGAAGEPAPSPVPVARQSRARGLGGA